MTAQGLRAAALAVLGVGLSAALFFSCYERREVESPTARSREAIRNPYLALGRLLERMGHTVVRIEGAGRLGAPPPDATLVLPVPRRTLRGAPSARLHEWVAAGGHLIVVSHSPWDDPQREEDPLLDPLGFRLLQVAERRSPFDLDTRCGCPRSSAGVKQGSGSESGPAQEAPTAPPDLREAIETALRPPVAWDEAEASWPGRDEPLAARFDRRFRWGDGQARARWALAGTLGVHVLQIGVGAGAVTALSDDLFLRNEHIGHADHGELALRLARMDDRQGPIWIVVSEDWPGLATLLRQHATPALVSALVLTLAWLARGIRRFGPLRPGPEPRRRRWMEHVEAVGRFHWRDDRGRVLLAGVRGSLLRELERRRPDWARLEAAGRARQLAAATGFGPDRVAQALDPEAAPQGEAAFVSMVADLERIRASL